MSGAAALGLSSVAVVAVFKIARAMVLWISLYAADKVFQDAFVQRVLASDGDPPDLRWFVPCALAIDATVMILLCTILSLVRNTYKLPTNTFIVDAPLVLLIVKDYVATTLLILALGVALASVAQSESMFRYREDGMRGVRAFGELMLPVSFVAVSLPFYQAF